MSETLKKAMDALARRSRSERELRTWLGQREHSREDIDAAVSRLYELGLLDDRKFASGFARSRLLGKGTSRRRIQSELARKGVARNVVDEALDEVVEDEQVDESTLVDAAARKKLRSLANLGPETQRRRLFAFLLRRGYDLDDVKRAVDTLLRG